MSFHDADSDVGRLNRGAATHAIAVDPWTYRVLATALDLAERSNGAFDITVAPVLQRLGLLPGLDCTVPPLPIWRCGRRHLSSCDPAAACVSRQPHCKIDLGGIAKGFAVDCAIDVLRARGIESGVVNAGGDLAVFGKNAHAICVRHPQRPGQLICRVDLTNGAMASSGCVFDPVHGSNVAGAATIDPRTQQPVCAVAGATVRASSCMMADALTKPVMILGKNSHTLLKNFGAEALGGFRERRRAGYARLERRRAACGLIENFARRCWWHL